MDENKLEQIYRVIQRRYEEGYRDGQNAALGELAGQLERKFPREPKRARRPETRPRLKNPAETLAAPVLEAIAALTADHPDGVEPTTIAEHLARTGIAVDLRQVRVALRHLTLSGTALRVTRGRYLHAARLTPTPVAAE